jgi:hypothetical protein
MSKSFTYRSRYVWIVRKDRKTFACGSTIKQCAEAFARKMTNV